MESQKFIKEDLVGRTDDLDFEPEDPSLSLKRFKSEGDVDFVLAQGPWTIMGHYLIVKPWNPHFDCSTEEIESVIAWIRLPGMALHYYHKSILRMLGQIIDSVVRIDYNTEPAARGKFTLITVEVALNKPLVAQFLLDGKIQKTINNCTRPLTVAGNVTQGSLKFGPWMVVTKKGRSRTEKGKKILRDVTCGHQESFGKESRFEILATMNEGVTDPDENMALSASITETHVPTNKIPRKATFPKNQPLKMKSPPHKPTVDILERDHLPQDKSNTDTLPNKIFDHTHAISTSSDQAPCTKLTQGLPLRHPLP
ncbi:hypothetical protein KPL70_021912 [Citrus sinensis]|nr:hypothetical protein KPL70_021912 [Citrus sinensis]